MGIHAVDTLSHLAYDATEPHVPDQYDYDEYAVSEYDASLRIWKIILRFQYWQDARTEFINLFVEERRKVRLIGRVFN